MRSGLNRVIGSIVTLLLIDRPHHVNECQDGKHGDSAIATTGGYGPHENGEGDGDGEWFHGALATSTIDAQYAWFSIAKDTKLSNSKINP